MIDCVEYQSLMDYLKDSRHYSNDTRAMLNTLINILLLKEMIDYREVDAIRNGGFMQDEQSKNR